MHLARSSGPRAALTAAVFAAAVLLPSLAAAQDSGQRLSLADRVNRLEQQSQQAQGGVGLVNQVQQLQSQIQQLQGQVEELQHQLQLMQQSSKDQYVDLDSRLGRLEGRAPAAGGAVSATDTGPVELGDVQLGGQAASGSGTAAGSPNDPSAAGNTGNTSQGDPQADYDRAFSALRNGDFASASRLFSAFISNYPDTPLTPNAYYWLGESYYGTQNYQVALETFQKLLQRFPADAKAAGAMLKVGYCQYELKQFDAARSSLNSVKSQFPDTQEARLAEGRLRALDMHAGN